MLHTTSMGNVGNWNFADLWEVVADELPDAPAAIHGDRRITWAEFDHRADGIAKTLLERSGATLDYENRDPPETGAVVRVPLFVQEGEMIRVATRSGGNIQKVLLARVLSRDPKVVIVSQPTRGLDVGASEYVREELLARRAEGAAILLMSEDLDELVNLSDRIVVLYEGRIVGRLDAAQADPEHLGMLMAGRATKSHERGGATEAST